MTPLTDLMGTIRLDSVNLTPHGRSTPNSGKSRCCSDTCQPQ